MTVIGVDGSKMSKLLLEAKIYGLIDRFIKVKLPSDPVFLRLSSSKANILPLPSIAPITAWPPEKGCPFFPSQPNSVLLLFTDA